jgi:hypothetical protein
VRLSHLSLLKTERASPNKSEADTGQAMYESPPNNSTESLLPRELWVRGLVCVCVFVCVCVYVCVCVCVTQQKAFCRASCGWQGWCATPIQLTSMLPLR